MIDFSDLDEVLIGLKASQDADEDIRDQVREAHNFVDKRDGQWEPDIYSQFKAAGKPRYTFDKTNPVVDQIAGEMENADFTLKVRPAGGEATKDVAKTLDGLIRNIRNISNAEHVFDQAGRSMVTGGMDGWEIVQDWVDGDSFDQDLFIKRIHNWVDRVWFDSGSEAQDHTDAEWVVVLQNVLTGNFESKYPDMALQSVGAGRISSTYFNKPDFVTIGRILYKKPRTIEIVRMNNGKVYQINDDYEKVKDELAKLGVTPELDADGNEKTRKRKAHRVYSRLFSGSEWLNKEQETVFDHLPVCATYGNFKISDSKRIVRGIVEHLMDEQRVYNYGGSEQVRQTALAPVDKIFMTKEQAAGQKKLASMNTNNDPVQTYTHQADQPQPFKLQPSQANNALQTIMQRASDDLNASAGQFASNMGDNPGLQSGVAIDRQIAKGDNGMTKWFSAQEVAICYAGKVLVNAIPRVYDASRQVRVLGEDGAFSMVELNQTVIDEQSGQEVTLQDLSVGEYDTVCEMGPAFKSRMRETAAAFVEIAAIDPTIMETGRDIWMNNLDAPGMDLMAERARGTMVMNGQIPQEQLTEDEKALLQQQAEQQAGQPQEPSPEMVFAQAEATKAANEETKTQISVQEKTAQIQLDGRKQDLAEQEFSLKREMGLENLDFQQDLDLMKLRLDELKTETDAYATMSAAVGKEHEITANIATQLATPVTPQ